MCAEISQAPLSSTSKPWRFTHRWMTATPAMPCIGSVICDWRKATCKMPIVWPSRRLT
jgi:hypothetical protein